ncbi:MAG: dipeptidase [Candidatus Hydrogenedentota bacterium]|nr:MAG: dipeptidase [Candidatus Hydrogenedentota bacterium]
MKKASTPSSHLPDLFFCDAHIDTLSKMLKFGWNSLAEIPDDSPVTAGRLRRSKVGLAVFAIFTEKRDRSLTPLLRTLRMTDTAYSIAHENSEWVELVTDAGGITRARKKGKIAMVLSMENGIAIGNDLGLLRNFYRLGVRLMSLTWNHRNQLGDGVGVPNARRGLTLLGRETIHEMERLGIIIDVSHLNERTFWQVVEVSGGPIVATHSNAFSICKSPRNLTDAQIRAISERNGFVGLNFCGHFLNDSGEASIDDVVRHAYHIAGVGGAKVLALGSDFDGTTNLPAGLEHMGKMGRLIDSFRKAGFSNADIEDLSHRNFLRVFRKVCG